MPRVALCACSVRRCHGFNGSAIGQRTAGGSGGSRAGLCPSIQALHKTSRARRAASAGSASAGISSTMGLPHLGQDDGSATVAAGSLTIWFSFRWCCRLAFDAAKPVVPEQPLQSGPESLLWRGEPVTRHGSQFDGVARRGHVAVPKPLWSSVPFRILKGIRDWIPESPKTGFGKMLLCWSVLIKPLS
jgi:hypothetical protein